MRIVIAAALLLFFFCSCSSAKKSQSTAQSSSSSPSTAAIAVTDENYGYAEQNPVKVGGTTSSGPANERAYLNSLTGPNGEALTFVRKGSCCPFKTPNGIIDNTGMLDRYEVTYSGLAKPVIIYINMYDKEELKAPKGFKFKD